MQMKRMICMLIVVSLILCQSCFQVVADEIETDIYDDGIVLFATNSYDISVNVKSIVKGNASFSLEAGEIVQIKAHYSPINVSMDFGLLDSNGTYYYINTTNGSIDKAIQIEKKGNYTFQIRNNSNYEVQVSGYVNN